MGVGCHILTQFRFHQVYVSWGRGLCQGTLSSLEGRPTGHPGPNRGCLPGPMATQHTDFKQACQEVHVTVVRVAPPRLSFSRPGRAPASCRRGDWLCCGPGSHQIPAPLLGTSHTPHPGKDTRWRPGPSFSHPTLMSWRQAAVACHL